MVMMGNLEPVDVAERSTAMAASAARALRRAIAVALSFACLAASHSDAAAAVFGRDDRKPVSTVASVPGSAGVGRLSSSTSGRFCTAFCVADDIIATAGHCLVGTDAGDAPNLEDLAFSLVPDSTTQHTGISTPAPVQSGLAGRAGRTAALNIISGLRQLRTRAPMNAAGDWAIAKLEAPICKGRVLELATEQQAAPSTNSSSDIRGVAPAAFTAWHADTKQSALHIETDCAPLTSLKAPVRRAMARDFTSRKDLLIHGCDTGPGASGAPLLATVNGRPIVAAINTGTYTLVGTEPSEAGHGNASTDTAIANTAVSVDPLRAAIADLRQRKILVSHDGLVRLKHMLNTLGYVAGAANGPTVTPVSDSMFAAIVRFERDRGRRPTGSIDDALLNEVSRALFDSSAVRAGSPAGSSR